MPDKQPKISIFNWDLGEISNEFSQSKRGGQKYLQLDNYSSENVLKVSEAISADVAIAALATDFEYFNDDSGNGTELYAIAGTIIWRKRSGTWTAVHTNTKTVTAGSFQFLKAYDKAAAATTKKALYYTADGFLGVYYYSGSEVWNDSVQILSNADTKAHPMVVTRGYLYIGDGNYISRLEPAGASFDPDALIMTEGLRAVSMRAYNDRVCIGTFKGAALTDVSDCRLVVWEGITGVEESESIPLGERGITALEVYQNYLIIFAGIKGNIYKYNGALIQPFKTIKNVSRQVYVKPSAVTVLNNRLLFGLSDDNADLSETALQGVYSIHRRKPEDDFSLTLDYLESGGASALIQIGAIKGNVAGTAFNFSRYNNSNYKIDISSANKATLATTGEFNSQKYLWATGNNGDYLRGVELIAKPMASGTSVAVYYKRNNETSWNLLHTFTSSNQELLKDVTTRLGKIFQIRLILTASGANSPEIYSVLLY